MIKSLQRSLIWASAIKQLPCLISIFLLIIIAGCSKEDDSYFPLKEGLWWEYQETLTIRDETFIQKRITRTLPEVHSPQGDYFAQEAQGRKTQYYRIEEAGILRYDLEKQPPQTDLLLPFDHSITWTLTSRLGVIESRTFAPQDRILTRPKPVILSYVVLTDNDEVVVPAGRFTHCLKIQGTGRKIVKVDRGNASAEIQIESTDWYAPGVGLVKTERVERSESSFLKAGRYRLELLRMYK